MQFAARKSYNQLRAGTKSPLVGNYDQIEKGMPDQARTSGHERIDIEYVGGGAHVLDLVFYSPGEEDCDL